MPRPYAERSLTVRGPWSRTIAMPSIGSTDTVRLAPAPSASLRSTRRPPVR